jgi:ATP-binding cassette subfamily F protein 3
LIVHDGIVDRFDHSLDDYPAWLKEREEESEQAEAKWQDTPAKTVNKKQQRQEQAQQRQRLKPLYDKVRDTEKQIASKRSRLAELEACLADESIYADPGRKDELTELIRDQASLKSKIESLEWEWLEASESLEQAKG